MDQYNPDKVYKPALHILAFHPAALDSIPSIPPKNFRGKVIDVAEVNQRHWVEESGLWHENVDRTHLHLASGKPVLQMAPNLLVLSCLDSDSSVATEMSGRL